MASMFNSKETILYLMKSLPRSYFDEIKLSNIKFLHSLWNELIDARKYFIENIPNDVILISEIDQELQCVKHYIKNWICHPSKL